MVLELTHHHLYLLATHVLMLFPYKPPKLQKGDLLNQAYI